MYVETSSLYSNIAVPEAFEFAAKAALGLFNKTTISTKNTNSKNTNKKNNNSNNINSGNSNNVTLKNKNNIKSELKGKAKNCCVM